MRAQKSLILASAAALALAGCTTNGGPLENAGPKQTNGAVIGGVVGGLFGATRKGDNKLAKGAVGAAAGAIIGGAIGAQLDKQAEDLRGSLSNSDIQVVNTGSELLVIMPQGILFDVDSAEVKPSLYGDLGALADNLQQYPNSVIDVIGHTDNTGSASYNEALSTDRARAVTGVLANNGVDSARLRPIGLGEDRPVASNQTEEGRAANRRVEVVIRPIT